MLYLPRNWQMARDRSPVVIPLSFTASGQLGSFGSPLRLPKYIFIVFFVFFPSKKRVVLQRHAASHAGHCGPSFKFVPASAMAVAGNSRSATGNSSNFYLYMYLWSFVSFTIEHGDPLLARSGRIHHVKGPEARTASSSSGGRRLLACGVIDGSADQIKICQTVVVFGVESNEEVVSSSP